jgi:Family of unknown function (DUF5670)
MGNVYYVIALILIIIWAIGFFALNSNSSIHMLLVASAIVILVRINKENKIVK